MKTALRYIAFSFFMLMLMLPALQKEFRLFKEKNLHGAFIPAPMPEFSWKSWFSGEFQGNFDRFIEDHIGFRSSLVRLKNQLDFSLFRKPNAEGVVVGKKDFLYEYDYIRDYTGKDFVGMDFIRQKLLRAAFVQKYLKDSLGIDFIIVLEPGKASFYPEYIPEKYLRDQNPHTNLKAIKSTIEELGIQHLDYNEYFLELKSTATYPLFPKYGTHWSVYGMSVFADSLLHYMEKLQGQKMPEARVKGYEVSRIPRDTDNDVEKPLNLIFSLPGEELAFPLWEMDTLGEGYRPMVLSVADSYYWNFFNARIPQYIFANQAFWYFNAKVFPDTYYKATWVKDLDLRKEVEKQDMIFLMVTERFMHVFDWRFIDMLYELYAPEWLNDEIYENRNRIIDYEPWFDKLIVKAENNKVPLEEVLRNEATYLYLEEKRPYYLIEHGYDHYVKTIRSDTSWYAQIVEKAARKNIPVEDQLKIDALYAFQIGYPDLYEIHMGTMELIRQMKSDPETLEQLKKEAMQYGSPSENYIFKKAFHNYKMQSIENTGNTILNSPGWLSDVTKKAEQRGIPLEEMIRLDAEYMWDLKITKK